MRRSKEARAIQEESNLHVKARSGCSRNSEEPTKGNDGGAGCKMEEARLLFAMLSRLVREAILQRHKQLDIRPLEHLSHGSTRTKISLRYRGKICVGGPQSRIVKLGRVCKIRNDVVVGGGTGNPRSATMEWSTHESLGSASLKCERSSLL